MIYPAFLLEENNMKVITSKDNRIYKQCSALAAKKYRDKTGLYLVEGEKIVNEACEAGMVETIIISEGCTKEIKHCGADTVFMMGRLFEKLAHTQTSQGILAVVKKKAFNEEAFMKAVKTKDGKGGNIIVLDRLQDPGNIGTIIRTADAAGYAGLIAIKGTGDIYSPKVVRAAAGSVLRLPIFFAENGEEAINILKRGNKKIVSTAFDTDIYYYDADLSENTALVIGNEGNGISREFLEKGDIKIKIPMSENVDSLNAAVAAGILMYHRKGSVK